MREKRARRGAYIPPVGTVFGLWTVIGPCTERGMHAHIGCRCACGVEREVRLKTLKDNHSRSCGRCVMAKRGKHGAAKDGVQSAEYRCWTGMRRRCGSPAAHEYPLYGARGIRVCERWNDFAAFFSDMGPKPSPLHSIDRIDVNGNYEPTNCRWATRKEQQRNMRRTKFLTIEGIRRPLSDWAERVGLTTSALNCRIIRGWDPGEAVFGRIPAIALGYTFADEAAPLDETQALVWAARTEAALLAGYALGYRDGAEVAARDARMAA